MAHTYGGVRCNWKKNGQDLHELIEMDFPCIMLRGKKATCIRVSTACYHLCEKEGEIRKHAYFV